MTFSIFWQIVEAAEIKFCSISKKEIESKPFQSERWICFNVTAFSYLCISKSPLIKRNRVGRNHSLEIDFFLPETGLICSVCERFRRRWQTHELIFQNLWLLYLLFICHVPLSRQERRKTRALAPKNLLARANEKGLKNVWPESGPRPAPPSR